jgi:hypothetical protein
VKGTYIIAFRRHYLTVTGSKVKRLYVETFQAQTPENALLALTFKLNRKGMDFFDLNIVAIVCVDSSIDEAVALTFDPGRNAWVGLPLDYQPTISGLSNKLGLDASTQRTPPASPTNASITRKRRSKSTG